MNELLVKVEKKVTNDDDLHGYDVEVGLKSLTYFPTSGMLTQVELRALSEIASESGLHFYVSSHRDRVYFVMYIP